MKEKLIEYGFNEQMVNDLLKGKTINTFYAYVKLNEEKTGLVTKYHDSEVERVEIL